MNRFHLLDLLEQHFKSLSEIRLKALENDSELMAFLLSNEALKEQFFTQVALNVSHDSKNPHDFTLIFEKEKFLEFLNLRVRDGSYTKFESKIGLSSGGKFLKNCDDVVLNFAYKDCVLKGAQSKDDDKSKEILFNEILAHSEIDALFSPKALCNFELITRENATNPAQNGDSPTLDSHFTPPPPQRTP